MPWLYNIMRGSLIIFCVLVFGHCSWGQDSPASTAGTITIRKPEAKPAVDGSLDKMPLLYTVVDNLITVTVPGFTPRQVRASLSGVRGSIREGDKPSEYLVKVQHQGTCYISAEVERSPGQWKVMDVKEYWATRLPPPIASFMGVEGEGSLTPAKLQAGRGVMAKLPNYVGPLKYEVTSFDLSLKTGPGMYQTLPSTNNRLTPDMMQHLKDVKKGDIIIFENVKAKSPKTPIEKIPGITITVGKEPEQELEEDGRQQVVASFMKVEGEGALTPGRLKAAQGLMAKMPNYVGPLKYMVTSFDLTVDALDGTVKTFSSTSNRLTPEMRQYLKGAKRGDIVIFKNVKAMSPETPIEQIPGITITVK